MVNAQPIRRSSWVKLASPYENGRNRRLSSGDGPTRQRSITVVLASRSYSGMASGTGATTMDNRITDGSSGVTVGAGAATSVGVGVITSGGVAVGAAVGAISQASAVTSRQVV